MNEYKNNISNFFLLIIAILVLLLISSCKAKRVEHTVYRTDTIKTSAVIKIRAPQLNNIEIEHPCDSLGNLKPFKYTFGTGNNKTVLKAVNDTIYLEQNIDSIVNSKIDTYKSSNEKESKKTIQYRIPKWCWYLLIYSILLTVWTLRKFIPYLKLLPI